MTGHRPFRLVSGERATIQARVKRFHMEGDVRVIDEIDLESVVISPPSSMIEPPALNGSDESLNLSEGTKRGGS